ncbi:MAG: DUF4492 domain-containing protein [Campylobacter sp.]
MVKKCIENITNLYIDGFKNMRLGKSLWLIIAIKLAIMFGILKVFVFDKNLNTEFKNDQEKSDFVILNLTKE